MIVVSYYQCTRFVSARKSFHALTRKCSACYWPGVGYGKREIIVAAAIVQPDGRVLWEYPPARHSTLIACSRWRPGNPCPQGAQGFVTSHGRYVDRADAARLAITAGQISRPALILFSEDLW